MKIINNITLFSLAASLLGVTTASEGGLRRRMAHEVETEENMVTIRVINAAYQQPFGGFFVMTHNGDETPLFRIGGNASEPLARLAEDGDPSPLVMAYNGSSNAGYVAAVMEDAPYFGGEILDFMVPYDANYPYVTIASMAINTNDCFIALNGVPLESKAVITVPGYDSGTEENNEDCASIPGPACADTPGNVESGNGEGFVHVHRGFFGIGSLTAAGYDWRNPMARIEMYMSEETAVERSGP